MIFPQHFSQSPFASTEGIDSEYEEAESRQSDTTSLHVRILLCPSPVSMHAEHGREFPRFVRYISVGSHPDIRQRLKDQLLNAITILLDGAQNSGVKCGRFLRESSPGFDEAGSNLVSMLLPVSQRNRRRIVSAQRVCLIFHELQKRFRFRWRCSRWLCGSY